MFTMLALGVNEMSFKRFDLVLCCLSQKDTIYINAYIHTYIHKYLMLKNSTPSQVAYIAGKERKVEGKKLNQKDLNIEGYLREVP